MINWWLFWRKWSGKDIKSYFQPGPLSEVFNIANHQNYPRRIWTCTEAEFKLDWMKLFNSKEWSFNSFMTEIPIIWKQVYWFVLQINGLPSIWFGPPSWILSLSCKLILGRSDMSFGEKFPCSFRGGPFYDNAMWKIQG